MYKMAVSVKYVKGFTFRMIITVFWASYFLQITMLLFKFYFDK